METSRSEKQTGRPQKSKRQAKLDALRTQAWAYAIARELGIVATGYAFAKAFARLKLEGNVVYASESAGVWTSRLKGTGGKPQQHELRSINLYLPEAYKVFVHPIWETIRLIASPPPPANLRLRSTDAAELYDAEYGDIFAGVSKGTLVLAGWLLKHWANGGAPIVACALTYDCTLAAVASLLRLSHFFQTSRWESYQYRFYAYTVFPRAMAYESVCGILVGVPDTSRKLEELLFFGDKSQPPCSSGTEYICGVRIPMSWEVPMEQHVADNKKIIQALQKAKILTKKTVHPWKAVLFADVLPRDPILKAAKEVGSSPNNRLPDPFVEIRTCRRKVTPPSARFFLPYWSSKFLRPCTCTRVKGCVIYRV